MHFTAKLNIPQLRTSTQVIFLICGLAVSSWAPMVPYAKDHLKLDEAGMGFLLLFLGAGALIMMPVTGWLITRLGSRKVILYATFVTAGSLPLLLVMNTSVSLALMLFVFGSGVGSVDVAMNAHGVQVQNISGKPIMSSLHGLFSVGGLLGSLGIGFLTRFGLNPIWAASCISATLLVLVLFRYNSLLDKACENELVLRYSEGHNLGNKSEHSWLDKRVLFLGFLCFAVFLSEGAMLDWSAILLRDFKHVEDSFAGIGYASFSIAMAVMRLVGDRILTKMAPSTVVIGGSLIAASGFLIIIFSPWLSVTLLGFILVGVGAANTVPVFFSEGGRLKNVPSTVAIPAITTMGYAGQLAGPAILGFLAQSTNLPFAFGFTAILLLLVAISYSFHIKSGS